MSHAPIRFDDGAAYERAMGVWSRDVGIHFLDWLAPTPGLSWVDVGCGNGAFTELLIERTAPAEVKGVDPSEGQIAFARTRAGTAKAHFGIGDAMALPFDADRFDAAAMALVIFFVPDPAKGLAEMVRVTRPGGLISAYAWDILGGGFPYAPIQDAMREAGLTPALPPSVEASLLPALEALWRGAGLEEVETTTLPAQRSYPDFDTFWNNTTGGGAIMASLQTLPPEVLERIRNGTRAGLKIDAGGGVHCVARANAVRGRVPLPRP